MDCGPYYHYHRIALQALVRTGPLSISINAGAGLDEYKGGIMTPKGLHHNTCPMYCCWPKGEEQYFFVLFDVCACPEPVLGNHRSYSFGN